MKSDFNYATTLEIAGITVGIETNHADIIAGFNPFYKLFRSSQPPQFVIRILQQAAEKVYTEKDQEITFRGDRIDYRMRSCEGHIHLDQQQGLLTTSPATTLRAIDAFVQLVYCILVFDRGGLLMHAAAVARDEQAYVFFGYSGSGKTTVARLSENDTVLNDDIIMVLPENGRWLVYGTPFWNPSQTSPSKGQAPLMRFYRLIQSKNVWVESISTAEGLAELLTCTPVIPADPVRNKVLVSRWGQIMAGAPVHKLHFRKDDSFWEVID